MFAQKPRGLVRVVASTFAAALAVGALAPLSALAKGEFARHVDWTRVNDADPDLVGLYHFDPPTTETGMVQPVHPSLPEFMGLLIGAAAADPLESSTSLVEPIFGPRSLRFGSAQSLETSANSPRDLAGDLTVEAWLQWDVSRAASSIEFGLRSGAKLRITRDPANSANDQFGIQGTHGDYRPAPGFPGWAAIGPDEAPFGEWIHIAMAIHSTGQHFDETLSHDVYNDGSVARFYLNGHAVGEFPHTLDVAGVRVHDRSKLRINNLSGPVFIDEFAVWARDWTANGTNANAFADGRGNGVAPGLEWTRVNTSDHRLLALYHFDQEIETVGLVQPTDMCLDPCVGLTIGTTDWGGLDIHTNLPGAPFGPMAGTIFGMQSLESSCNVPGDAAADTTIESWVRWDDFHTSSSIEIGFRSSAKLRLTRDPADPNNDEFGIQGTHGDYRPAPGFVDWPTLGDRAPYGEWFHVALTVDSTGFHFDETLQHDVYNEGSTARVFLDNGIMGATAADFAIDVAGLRIHDGSNAVVRTLTPLNTVSLDEVAMWNFDWSGGGSDTAPFGDGRGSGTCVSPTPTPSPTLSPSPSPSPTETASPSPTPSPTETPSPTPTPPLQLEWTRVNDGHPDLLGLYQFGPHTDEPGAVQPAHACLPDCMGLVIGVPAGDTIAIRHDTPSEIFNPHSATFFSAQSLESSCTAARSVDHDLTVEFWFRWNDSETSSSLEVGARSGAKLRITRDPANPANDQFGIQAVHGDYRSAPGFTNWGAVAPEQAPFGGWIHVAVAIHGTGLHFDETLSHDVYNDGSVARFFLNGSLFGGEQPLDLAGVRAHDHSKLRVNNLTGSISVDEIAIWARDWSENGAALDAFLDGRGDGTCPDLEWSRPNDGDHRLLGLYHFDPEIEAEGMTQPADECLDTTHGLIIGGGGTLDINPSTPGDPFDPNAATLAGAIEMNSGGNVAGDATADATIESWIRWNDDGTSSSFELGFRSSSKIRVSRDPANPENDQFGIQAVHGDYRDAPGFVDWSALGGRAPVGEWIHVAMTIHSTGFHLDETLNHDVYNEGSLARFWIDGNPVGATAADFALDVAGMRIHDGSRALVRQFNGSASIDEFTLWNFDWSENGGVERPFGDGRGSGSCEPPVPASLGNISTRGFVGTASEVMIAGIIVEGTEPRRVLISGVGPNLADFGVQGALANPVLALFQGQTMIATNDDWGASPDATAIMETGMAPVNALESAILMTLAPGEYTAFLSGADAATGIGLVQAFDVGEGDSRIGNISTRLAVGTGDRVMIGGFIVAGTESITVLVRGLGPTIGAPPFEVPNALGDPELFLFEGQNQLATNDNWIDSIDREAIQATGLAPANDAEPAILTTLAPGSYTAILQGVGGTEGTGLVEVYEIR